MIFPNLARYASVMVRVNEMFAREKITTFPIDPFEIIKNNKWGLMTYSEIADEQGLWIEDVIAAFQSEDGYTIYDGINYTIAYNDTIYSDGRIRFTLMHEIGHIYLNHLVDFDETVLLRSTLTETKYKVLENEANAFARNAMAPVMVVKDLNFNRVQNLVEFFGMSKAAAATRLKSIPADYRWTVSPFIRFQREQFNPFIRSCNHSKHCLICSHHFIHEEAKHCPVCGHSALINQKGVDQMIYNGYLLDDNSRALVCPRCENEHLNYEGDICKICGLEIINQCAPTFVADSSGWVDENPSCGTPLDGDARYCVKCGNESTFYKQGLLEDWKEEKKEIEHQKKLEELPF